MTVSQIEFYREFLMSRKLFKPEDFGVAMDRDRFDEAIVDQFAETYRDACTIDELLLHPSEALRFCSDVRRRHGWFDVPDDIILRVVMTRRKNPSK